MDERFEIKNGILGMLRDVCVKLMCVSSNHEKIRSLVGVDQEMYEYTKHPFFAWKVLNFIPPIVNNLKTQDKRDLMIGEKMVRILKSSNSSGWTWAFIDYAMESDTFIFHMNMRCLRPNVFDIGFGVMEVSDELPYGDTRNASKHALYHCHGEVFQNGGSDGNHLWRENDVIALEVDTRMRILRFYVNEELQPVAYCSVPTRLKFCVAEACQHTDYYSVEGAVMIRFIHRLQVTRISSFGDEIEFLSFRRFVTPPPLLCPPAEVYDPDHYGYKARVVEWNYLDKKKRR